MITTRTLSSCALLWFAAGTLTTEGEPSFEGLGDLPGGNFKSIANGVSADGSSVCGNSSSTSSATRPNLDTEAFRWRAETGMEGLGFISLSPSASNGKGISGDGSSIAGLAAFQTTGSRASYWTEGSRISSIGTLPGGGFPFSDGNAMSDDGQRIVGISSAGSGVFRAFLWTRSSGSSGSMISLGRLESGTLGATSEANGISADGSFVVGSSTKQDGTPGSEPGDPDIITSTETEAFVWNSSDLMSGLGDLPGGPKDSQAFAVSDDGSVVVGYGSPQNDSQQGVVWIDGSINSVGDLPGGDESCRLLDVSASGEFAVGTGTDENGSAAVIWDQSNGLRSLSSALSDMGLLPTDWTLTSAVGISSNGDVIVGNATNPSGDPEAWRLIGALALFAPAEPEAPSVSIELGTIISFPTSPGNIYQVEVSTSTTAWVPLGDSHSTIEATSLSTYHLVDPTNSSEMRFYRVVLLPGSISGSAPVPSLSEGAALTFQSEPNLSYQAYQSENLINWIELGDPISTESDDSSRTQTVIHNLTVFPSANPTHNSYRVEVSPP